MSQQLSINFWETSNYSSKKFSSALPVFHLVLDGLSARFVQVLQKTLEQTFKDSLIVTCSKCTTLQVAAAVDPAENSDYIIFKLPFYRLIFIYLDGIYQKSWKKKIFRVNKPICLLGFYV